VVTEQGHYAQAQALLDESRAISQALGDQARVAWVTLHQARLLFLVQHEQEQAQRLAEQSLAQFEAQGIGWMRARALSLLGHMHLARGEWAQARAKLEESAVYLQETGNRCDSCEPLLGLARVALGQQVLGEARRRAQESLRIQVALGSQALFPACLEVVGRLLSAAGKAREATLRWGRAEALREELGAPLHPVERADYEQVVAAARRELGEEAFAAAWVQGRTMTLEQVLTSQEHSTLSEQETAALQPSTEKDVPTSPTGLTARELEVLCLVAQGLTDAQVAEKLVISRRTVNWHLTSIYSKLGVSSRAAATRYAIEHQMV
jgi:DNA-binding CsgD family transcriptional regulator